MNITQSNVVSKLAAGSEKAQDPAVRSWAQNFVKILAQLLDTPQTTPSGGSTPAPPPPTFTDGSVYVLRPLEPKSLVVCPYDNSFKVGQWTAVEQETNSLVTLIDSLLVAQSGLRVPYQSFDYLTFACYRKELGKFELMVVGSDY